MDVSDLLQDLDAEHAALDALVAPLDDAGWSARTPAEGWTVLDSVSHLSFFDGEAELALTDPDAFRARADDLLAGRLGAADVELGRSLGGPALLQRWRASRSGLSAAIAAAPKGHRVPWYGPAMSVASFTTARIMETWSHGQDVVDALGAEPVVSGRLRHVLHIGVGARAYAFVANGVDDPGDPVRVEAAAPDGTTWAWGPEGAPDVIRGAALDLALAFTRRRHLDDVDLEVVGPTAQRWASIVQAFAGPPGPSRAPGLSR